PRFPVGRGLRPRLARVQDLPRFARTAIWSTRLPPPVICRRTLTGQSEADPSPTAGGDGGLALRRIGGWVRKLGRACCYAPGDFFWPSPVVSSAADRRKKIARGQPPMAKPTP